jgi:hypothetical protein
MPTLAEADREMIYQRLRRQRHEAIRKLRSFEPSPASA